MRYFLDPWYLRAFAHASPSLSPILCTTTSLSCFNSQLQLDFLEWLSLSSIRSTLPTIPHWCTLLVYSYRVSQWAIIYCFVFLLIYHLWAPGGHTRSLCLTHYCISYLHAFSSARHIPEISNILINLGNSTLNKAWKVSCLKKSSEP